MNIKRGILILVLIIIMIFSINGCDIKDDSNKNTKTNEIDLEIKKDILNILIAPCLPFPKYNNIDEWESYINDEYKIDINIEYLPLTDFSDFINPESNLINDLVNNDEFSGLIYLWSSFDARIYELSKENVILPITEYLNNNEVYNSLPKEIQNKYSLLDGQVWAIPATYNYIPKLRLIKNDWLVNLNEKQPSTLEEFYTVVKRFTYEDPNNSNADDTYGIAVNYKLPLMYLADIFYADGFYIDKVGTSSIAYDRQTNSIEDAFNKEGIEKTLNYISLLSQEGIINKVQYYTMNDFKESKIEGSYYYYAEAINDYDNYDIIWYFDGTNKTNIACTSSGTGAYVLTKNTKNPQETIDAFINTFFASDKGYYSAYSGIEGVDYSIKGNTFIDLSASDGTRIIGQYAPYLMTNGYATTNVDGIDLFPTKDFITSEINELFSDNKMFIESILDGPYDFTPNNFNANTYINDLIDQKISVEDLLIEYNEKSKENNMQEKLDKLNEELGTNTKYNYY